MQINPTDWMPEYDFDRLRCCIIHFANPEDRDGFARLIRQTTDDTNKFEVHHNEVTRYGLVVSRDALKKSR